MGPTPRPFRENVYLNSTFFPPGMMNPGRAEPPPKSELEIQRLCGDRSKHSSEHSAMLGALNTSTIQPLPRLKAAMISGGGEFLTSPDADSGCRFRLGCASFPPPDAESGSGFESRSDLEFSPCSR